MKEKSQKSVGMRILTAIGSIVMIFLGCYLFFNLKSIIWIFTVAVAINGVVMLVRFIRDKEGRRGLDVVLGVINIIFAAIMILGATETRVLGVLMIELYIGIWAIVTGFGRLFIGLAMKKESIAGSGLTMAGGVVLGIVGVIFIVSPMAGAAALVWFTAVFAGIAFIVMGLNGLADAFAKGK